MLLIRAAEQTSHRGRGKGQKTYANGQNQAHTHPNPHPHPHRHSALTEVLMHPAAYRCGEKPWF